jgi:hypothetical protein
MQCAAQEDLQFLVPCEEGPRTEDFMYVQDILTV